MLATGKNVFSFLDVHSGRSIYDLPDSGAWKKGVGEFAVYCRNKHSLTNELQYFCDIHSIGNVAHTRKYFGSSRIIMNVLKDLEINRISAILCDTDPSVCSDLEKQYQDTPMVEICRTDGYKKAKDTDSVNLVFIDPPDIKCHYEPLITLVRHCIAVGQPFVSWNPLHGNVKQKKMSRNCLSISQLAEEEKIPSITVRWTNGWSGQMCGCQMLFSIPYLYGNKVVKACGALTSLMNWKKIDSD